MNCGTNNYVIMSIKLLKVTLFCYKNFSKKNPCLSQYCTKLITSSYLITSAQGLITPKHEPISPNRSGLFDFNVTTCINSTAALHPVGFYIMDLSLSGSTNMLTVAEDRFVITIGFTKNI